MRPKSKPTCPCKIQYTGNFVGQCRPTFSLGHLFDFRFISIFHVPLLTSRTNSETCENLKLRVQFNPKGVPNLRSTSIMATKISREHRPLYYHVLQACETELITWLCPPITRSIMRLQRNTGQRGWKHRGDGKRRLRLYLRPILQLVKKCFLLFSLSFVIPTMAECQREPGQEGGGRLNSEPRKLRYEGSNHWTDALARQTWYF